MATTTNFGWTTPDDTALVKDGASAIRSLGSAIDTSLGGAWTSYTPTWTNLTVGNGVNSFFYKQINKTVFIRGRFDFGSTSSISGAVNLTLPVAKTGSNAISLTAMLGDASGNAHVGRALFVSNTEIRIFAINASATYAYLSDLSSTIPFTWTTTDYITILGSYEAA